MKKKTAGSVRVSRRRFISSGARTLVLAACAIRALPGPTFGAQTKKRVTFKVLNGKACGACRKLCEQLLKKRYTELEKCFPEGVEVTFAIGKNNNSIPRRTIALGKCSKHLQKKAPLFIDGCVPKENGVVNAIKKASRNRGKTVQARKRHKDLFGKG